MMRIHLLKSVLAFVVMLGLAIVTMPALAGGGGEGPETCTPCAGGGGLQAQIDGQPIPSGQAVNVGDEIEIVVSAGLAPGCCDLEGLSVAVLTLPNGEIVPMLVPAFGADDPVVMPGIDYTVAEDDISPGGVVVASLQFITDNGQSFVTWPVAVVSPASMQCPDLTRNSGVGVDDLLIVLEGLDSYYDVDDLIAVILGWGACDQVAHSEAPTPNDLPPGDGEIIYCP